RTVRAIDLDLQELFADSKKHLFPGNPLEHLDEYQRLTEWSILVRVSEWSRADDPVLRELGLRWQKLLRREVQWKMACERTIVFRPGVSERSSVFSDAATFESAVRGHLPDALRAIPLKVDTARLVHRPGAHAPAAGQNFLYDTATDEIRRLDDRELFRQLPVSFRICRVYAQDNRHDRELARAMDRLLQSGDADDVTNM
ncbi:MAG: metal-dependent phosphohydrolase, partial [Pirellulaceae bacterium]|nr:metal-dependent phosphohydrolase [Pirellulaceae bacterium]